MRQLDRDTVAELQELQGIVESEGRELLATDVYERARAPSSALHKIVFAENEAEAAYQHRLGLCRDILGAWNVYARVLREGGDVEERPVKVRAVYHAFEGRKAGFPHIKVLREDPARTQSTLDGYLAMAIGTIRNNVIGLARATGQLDYARQVLLDFIAEEMTDEPEEVVA